MNCLILTRPFEDKESYRWAQGLKAINAAREACPTTQFVLVADAEADIYDLMVAERHAGVDLLIRAGQDRHVLSTPRLVGCGRHCRWERRWANAWCIFPLVMAKRRARQGHDLVSDRDTAATSAVCQGEAHAGEPDSGLGD
ncbi:hypothetical protein [Kouleothrix sp.]|uniref:hypothetical protein n=1 Tax=Kouleothrix sp. TaxID=2779161 RepID=UPI003918E15D